MKKIIILITTLILVIWLTSCNNPISQKVENNEIKKEIAWTNSWITTTKEEVKIKNIENKKINQFYLNICKGQTKKYYNEITKLKLSPDWKGYSFIANINNTDSKDFGAQLSILVKDWKEIRSKYWIDDFVYSNDWKQFAYTEIAEDSWRNIIKDWKKIKKWGDPIFSPDWKSFSYITNDGIGQILVKDWVENKKYYLFDWLTYSPNSESFSYIATIGQNINWSKVVVKDWIEWMPYDSIWNLIYSPDSKHYAFVANLNWKNKIIKDWIELFKYSNKYTDIQNLKFSNDSKELYFSARKIDTNKYVFIENWIEGIEYDNIEKVIYSPNLIDYALIVKDNNNSFVLDSSWHEWEKFNSINSIKYSINWDLAYLWYHSEREKWWISLIVNWKELKKFTKTTIDDLEFSLETEGFIFLVNEDKWYRVVKTCKN
jgi:hypothetical protein